MGVVWLPVGEDEPVLPQTDYLVEIGPFPVTIPTDIPGVITGPWAALFSTFGLWDARFRGDGNRLFISYRTA